MGFWSLVGTTSNHKRYDVCNRKRQIPVLLSILGWDKTGDHFRLEAVAACLCDTFRRININLGEGLYGYFCSFSCAYKIFPG